MGWASLTMRTAEFSRTPTLNPGTSFSVSLVAIHVLLPSDDLRLDVSHPNLRVQVDGDTRLAHARAEGVILRERLSVRRAPTVLIPLVVVLDIGRLEEHVPMDEGKAGADSRDTLQLGRV